MKKKESAQIFYCKNCKKPFKAWVSSKRVFCSRKCQIDEFSPAYKNGRMVDSYGYIMVYKPTHPNARSDGYIFEHRLVMSDYLKKPLKREEHIHHINENRIDNRIENLKVVTLGEHNAFHRIGTTRSEETKRKISESLKRRFTRL